MARVLQQENEVAEINEELERTKEQCDKQENVIESLQSQVCVSLIADFRPAKFAGDTQCSPPAVKGL